MCGHDFVIRRLLCGLFLTKQPIALSASVMQSDMFLYIKDCFSLLSNLMNKCTVCEKRSVKNTFRDKFETCVVCASAYVAVNQMRA